MPKKIIASLLVAVTIVSTVTLGAFAVFRDAETIPGNTISTGSVDITLSGDDPTKMPVPIYAKNLMPGEWSDWTRVGVTNNSEGSVKVYFYVIDLGGGACGDTNLELVTGPNGGNETATSIYNSKVTSLNGISHKVEVTGYVFDPTMPAGAVAAFHMRAGLDNNASSSSMGKSCSWTGVFVAVPVADEEPPMSFPTSFPTSFPEV